MAGHPPVMTTATSNIENWDDDLELDGPLPTQPGSTLPSISSRLSIRSASNAGDDDWQLPLKLNDEQSTLNAIACAKTAGIPIPNNVPSSALLGGSIKRLGKKQSQKDILDDWTEDLELPDRLSGPLQLRPMPMDAKVLMDGRDEFEDWAEGSLGIRTAGARREHKNRSSSTSAISPSIGSIMTMESEEDGLEGLVIPSGPINLEAALKRRRVIDEENRMNKRQHAPGAVVAPQTPTEKTNPVKDDFLTDIDFGNGDVVDTKRRALNRNVKLSWKPEKSQSPALKTQTSVTFCDKTPTTKIPRPIGPSRTYRLEPVFEVGATTVSRNRKIEPTTTSAQLLRQKRSMPVLRNHSSFSNKPPPGIFLARGNLDAQSHHINTKSPPQLGLRQDHEISRAQSPSPRTSSRLSATAAPDTPTRIRRDVAPASLAREAAARRTVTRPTRRRNFGDGTELDTFDDLPTSAAKESRFMKQPNARPPSKPLRAQISQSRLGMRDKMTTPQPSAISRSPTKIESLPRFARDTAASRIAREQTLGTVRPRAGESVLMPRTNWAAQVAARSPHTSPTAHRPKKKGPQLVNPMGKENIRHFQDEAAKKGMRWNSALCRWEGNESALLPFDPPAPVPPSSPTRPALITNFSGAAGVQVVGGMVFDPQRMCWLKLGATPSDPMSPVGEDEDDPFGGIEDLQDTRPAVEVGGPIGTRSATISGDWLVGEEFDLGPEFIRRQREEETAWKARVGSWFAEGRDLGEESYKWLIREIAATVSL